MRLSYPTNVKVVKVPCTGRVDIIHVLKVFENGADGVYVAGCLEGECHYLAGNLRARKRIAYVKSLLEEAGIGGARVEMYNLSSAQGQRFAAIAVEMTEKIRGLGPNPARRKVSGISYQPPAKDELSARDEDERKLSAIRYQPSAKDQDEGETEDGT